MEELFGLSMGVIVGWSMKVIFSDSEVRKLRRINEFLIKDRNDLLDRLDDCGKLYSKARESLLDLRRRYDKVYNNKYNK